MDRARLADFLRTRREALQPEDVGLPRGTRRRTGGLRREEVAVLSDMSIDYYSRLEQQRGPHPSEQMLGALTRGLRLSLEERDHVFQLAGYATPARAIRSDHLNPGMLRIFDGLETAAAQVVSRLGETLQQTRLSVALIGDDSVHTGLARSFHYRWFTDPAARLLYPEADRAGQSRTIVADLHRAHTQDGQAASRDLARVDRPVMQDHAQNSQTSQSSQNARNSQGSRSDEIVQALLAASPEFADLWNTHPVSGPYCAPKRLQHPEVGLLELHCQTLVDPDQSQRLVVYTATPGSESYQKLQLLSVIGAGTTPARPSGPGNGSTQSFTL